MLHSTKRIDLLFWVTIFLFSWPWVFKMVEFWNHASWCISPSKFKKLYWSLLAQELNKTWKHAQGKSIISYVSFIIRLLLTMFSFLPYLNLKGVQHSKMEFWLWALPVISSYGFLKHDELQSGYIGYYIFFLNLELKYITFSLDIHNLTVLILLFIYMVNIIYKNDNIILKCL
jgi:hypothetical protein